MDGSSFYTDVYYQCFPNLYLLRSVRGLLEFHSSINQGHLVNKKSIAWTHCDISISIIRLSNMNMMVFTCPPSFPIFDAASQFRWKVVLTWCFYLYNLSVRLDSLECLNIILSGLPVRLHAWHNCDSLPIRPICHHRLSNENIYDYGYS